MAMTTTFHIGTEGALSLNFRLAVRLGKVYPVLTFTQKMDTVTNNDITLFPSFDQMKEIHAALGELVKEIESLEQKEGTEEDEQNNHPTMQGSTPNS